jgi:hypothetical protein
MSRHAFLGRVAGAVAWPLVAKAQDVSRARRVGVLSSRTDHQENAFGRAASGNVRFNVCWAHLTAELVSACVAKFVAFAPDVIAINPETAKALGPRGMFARAGEVIE